MTSLAWPIELEWRLWFLGRKEEAYAVYHDRISKYPEINPPTAEEIREIFHRHKNAIGTSGLTPYEIFIRRRTQRVFVILQLNNLMGPIGHW